MYLRLYVELLLKATLFQSCLYIPPTLDLCWENHGVPSPLPETSPEGGVWIRWNGLDWTGLDWTGLDWTGLDWTGLDWTGLDWNGLDWTGLEWNGMEWNDQIICGRDRPLTL